MLIAAACLIDATGWYQPLRKNLGAKNCELGVDDIGHICDAFLAFEETEESKIFDNEAFGYWKVTVERPLRLPIDLSSEHREQFRAACGEANEEPLANVVDRVVKSFDLGPHLDFNRFMDAVEDDANPHDYDRECCVDLVQLTAFLRATQPEAAESLGLGEDGPTRRKFLARLQGEISKRGTIDVLRHGIKHGNHDLDLFYGTPSAENEKAKALFEQNRFTVTRQLRYSRDEIQLALDVGLFINGLPVFTFELKNSLTKQTVEDAVWQYKKDRDPREKLFAFGRCVAHFGVDESEVRFCTHLKGKASWFLPFNRGWNDGAGIGGPRAAAALVKCLPDNP